MGLLWVFYVWLACLLVQTKAFMQNSQLISPFSPLFMHNIDLIDDGLGLNNHKNHISARSVNYSTPVPDNRVHDLQILPNNTYYFSFSPKDVLANETGGYSLFITINTCTQPALNTSQANYTSVNISAIPQLTLFVSNVSTNEYPGPESPEYDQISQDLILGFANVSLYGVNETVYIGVYAPEISDLWMGSWTFEIGVSSVQPLHSFSTQQNLFLVDSDQTAALFTTGNLTLSANQSIPDFKFVVATSQLNFTFASLAHSYCATRSNPSDLTQQNADISLTTRGQGNLPKAQYYLHGLSSNTSYSLYQTLTQANLSSGGGLIYRPISFETKAYMNCQIVFNLSFCTDVAYAAPANIALMSLDQTAEFYDNLVSSLYTNFTYTLQTYQCQAGPESLFSPLRTCQDCADAYKRWLCAVNIPRCEDATNNASYLNYVGGNITSRQPLIDEVLKPGPYKEVLPCIGLCNAIVQNCPVMMEFSCPVQGTYGFDMAYGTPWDQQGVPVLKCNSPEQVYNVSQGYRSARAAKMKFLWGLLLLVSFCLVF